MKESNELIDIINQLKNLFAYKDGILLYNKKTQNKANVLLEQIATLTKTFDNTIRNEKSNIRNELIITDTTTGERRELIDIDSIDERVKNVLKSNNMFSCLKSLALCNKCAHSFDGNIKSTGEIFKKYYNILYPNEINNDEVVTFMQPLNVKFPKVINNMSYNLNNIDDHQFKKLCNVILNNNKEYNKGTKISVLKLLSISFNIKNDQEIDEEFNKVISNKDKIISTFLAKKYNEGLEQVKLQNKMFAIKDVYISMIGQLLKKDVFKNIKYELVKTEDAVPGFEYMLIIDDKDLSYYIEVHMPNFIATSLIREYGLVESTERTTKKLGASAVYKRETREIKEIYEALNNNSITDGRVRGEIISRDYQPESSEMVQEENNSDSKNYSEYSSDDYSFITNRITDKSTELEEYLKYKNIYIEDVENNKLIQLNENFPENITKEIVYNNYLNIYNSFNDNNKIEFISYSLNKLKNEDVFDKYLFNLIKDNYMNYNIDQLAKMIIYKNNLKSDFLDKNINKINEILYNQNNNKLLNKLYNSIDYKYNNINNILTDENKENINLLIDKYINDYIEYENNKEIDSDGPKHKR